MPKETLIYTFLHSSVHLHGRPRSKIPASDSAQILQQKSLTHQSATATLKNLRGHTSHPQETPNLDFFELRVINASQTGNSDDLLLAEKNGKSPHLEKKLNEWRMNGDRLRKSAYFGQDFLQKFKVWHFQIKVCELHEFFFVFLYFYSLRTFVRWVGCSLVKWPMQKVKTRASALQVIPLGALPPCLLTQLE